MRFQQNQGTDSTRDEKLQRNYKDTLIEGRSEPRIKFQSPDLEVTDYGEATTKVIYEENNPSLASDLLEDRIPSIMFSDSFLKKLIVKWERSLIIRTGQAFKDVQLLQRRLFSLWKIKSAMEIKDMGYNFYLIHGLQEDDRTKVLAAKPWKLGDYPLLVRTCKPNFIVEEEIKKRVIAV